MRPRRDDLIACFRREPTRGSAVRINNPQVRVGVLGVVPLRVKGNSPPVGRPRGRALTDSRTMGELLRVRSVSLSNPDVHSVAGRTRGGERDSSAVTRQA